MLKPLETTLPSVVNLFCRYLVDFLLKIVAKDWDDFQKFLTAKLTQAPKISNVKTSLNIRSTKKMPGIPFEIIV